MDNNVKILQLKVYFTTKRSNTTICKKKIHNIYLIGDFGM